MYGEVVMGIPHHDFEKAMDKLKKEVKSTIVSLFYPIDLYVSYALSLSLCYTLL
jgi:hypothetical protein